MGYLFKIIRSGSELKVAGTIDIPFLGAKVGELTNWTLTRRGDTGQDAALYDLHASFSFISKALWDDPDYEKRVILNLNPSKQYRLDQVPGMRTVLQDKSLLMDGVTIHAVPKER
jgi:hypothetical protein